MMRIPRSLALLALVAGALPTASVAAQDNIPWRLSYFPYLNASPNDGVMGIARAIWFQQAGWGERVTLEKYLALEAGYSTRDSWKASATFGAPRLTDDWRLVAHAEAGHEPNFGDFDAFQLTHDRALAWIDVTRRIRGPVHLAARAGVRRDELIYPGGPGFPDEPIPAQTDLSLRGAVVVDLRDREFEVNSGALLEAGAITGTGGADFDGYVAPYAHLRGWVHPMLPLRLTGRLAWRGTTGTSAIAPSLEFPGWEGEFTVLGGHRSHRALPIGARRIDGVVLAGAEARFDVINIGEIGAVTLIGFVDGGKLLYSDKVGGPPSENDWVVGAGGGIALRVLRAATLTITAARANDDTRWYVGSGWSW